MPQTAHSYKTLADGSINYRHYDNRARELRSYDMCATLKTVAAGLKKVLKHLLQATPSAIRPTAEVHPFPGHDQLTGHRIATLGHSIEHKKTAKRKRA